MADLDAKTLLAYLLFDPESTQRVPIRLPMQPEWTVLCSCGNVPHFNVSRELKELMEDNLQRVKIRWHEFITAELGGDVWVGRCDNCGKVFYGAIRRISPRRKGTNVTVTRRDAD